MPTPYICYSKQLDKLQFIRQRATDNSSLLIPNSSFLTPNSYLPILPAPGGWG